MISLKMLKDKHGDIVIWQQPNLPLYGWFGCKIAVAIIDNNRVDSILSQLGSAFLFVWAYLEITQGVTSFRRLLGLFVMSIIIMSFR